jgi:HEAT repeat protein
LHRWSPCSGIRIAGVREHVAHVLGKRADPGATDALVQAVTDESAVVAYKAVFALGRIRDPRSLETLVRSLAHADEQVRRVARDAIQVFGADAVPALMAALPDAPTEQRRQIAYALAASGSATGLAVVRELLADSDATIRFAALHGLAMADPSAAATVATSMQEDPDSRVRALVMRIRPQVR